MSDDQPPVRTTFRPTLAMMFTDQALQEPPAHDSILPPLPQLTADAQRLDARGFAAAWPGHYLLVTERRAAEGPPNFFQTAEVASQRTRPGDLGGGQVVGVLALRKRELGNAFAARITVGRARTNDVQLSDLSVSKTHAWLFEAEDGGRTTIKLCDGGSRNGTFVDGARVGVGATALRVGAVVRFGSVETRFVDSEGLRAALGSQAAQAAAR